VAALVTAGLAGCAAGPDFQRPTAPDVARYTATPVADRTASAPTQFGETQREPPWVLSRPFGLSTDRWLGLFGELPVVVCLSFGGRDIADGFQPA